MLGKEKTAALVGLGRNVLETGSIQKISALLTA
jgi:hypothetical protein